MHQENKARKFNIFSIRSITILIFLVLIVAGGFSKASKQSPNFINSEVFAFPEKELEPGAIQSYSLTVTNNGQTQANNVQARASITNNLQVLDVTSGKFDSDSHSAIWNIKSIAPGHSVTVSFMGRLRTDALDNEVVSVEMYVSSSELREHKVEARATKVKRLANGRLAKLVAFQTVSPNNPKPGEEVMLHVIVTNEGQLPAENVITSEQLPAELELLPDTIHPHLSNFARSTEPVANFDLEKNSIKVKVDKLMPSEWVALMFNARVRSNAQVGKELIPQALIKASSPDFQSVAPVTIGVTEPNAANLSVTVQADKNMASAGDKITYTIKVTNSGDTAANKLKITNKIPQGLTLASGSSTSSCGLKIVESAGQVLWKKGTVPANNGSCSVSFQATVNTGLNNGTVITDTAVVKSQSINVSANTTTTVQNNAASTAEVDVMDNFFSPATLMVPAGTMITWTQKGRNVHTVTGSNCNSPNNFTFSSDTQFPNGMRTGEKFSFAVPANAKAGAMVYYFCRFHGAPGNCTSIGPGMAGVVIVK
ncbi:MAG: DUF11 domain-containing protein [Acidobacteria bacterium]|nr:DUF11 domain-containing protein [Acidobacteriota bacterium]